MKEEEESERKRAAAEWIPLTSGESKGSGTISTEPNEPFMREAAAQRGGAALIRQQPVRERKGGRGSRLPPRPAEDARLYKLDSSPGRVLIRESARSARSGPARSAPGCPPLPLFPDAGRGGGEPKCAPDIGKPILLADAVVIIDYYPAAGRPIPNLDPDAALEERGREPVTVRGSLISIRLSELGYLSLCF